MTNEIIEGISMKLYEVFGADYPIYTENIEQNLQEPCFYIELVVSSRKKLPGQRYIANHQFDICYFSNASETKHSLNNVANKLFEALEYIQLANNDLLRAQQMNYRIVDDILHFGVNYNLVVRAAEQCSDKMETIKVYEGGK